MAVATLNEPPREPRSRMRALVHRKACETSRSAMELVPATWPRSFTRTGIGATV
jgi:hypothetical protein